MSTTREIAIAYVAYKELERFLKDKELPPGFSMDASGQEIVVKIPEGTTVSRDAGPNGDGIIKKKATQNLYGFAVWAFFLKRLKAFNQHKMITNMLLDAVREVLQTSGKTVEKQLVEIDPDFAQEVEALKQSMPIPMREEQTPRRIERNAETQISFSHKKLKEAA